MSTNTNSNQSSESKFSLSNEQKQKLKKYAVFASMGIICAVCMWFIFAPSANENSAQNRQSGFNTDIPVPTNESIIGDKREAYEQEMLRQRQSERIRSLDNFSLLLGKSGNRQQSNDLLLLSDEQPISISTGSNVISSRPSSMQSSMNAYQDINRTLSNFHQRPHENLETERLRRELETLQMQIQQMENHSISIDDQMVLMEKSFEMASRFLPDGGDAERTVRSVTNEATEMNNNISGRTTVVPVAQFSEQIVSALPQVMSNEDIIQAFSQPRNLGFITASTGTQAEQRNTISASIHADQTIMDGGNVRLRLLEPMRAGKILVRENTILSGFARIQGERLQITISSLEYNGSIIPVEIAVFDTDGQRGIFIPDAREVSAAKEIAANMGTSAGTSINLANDAGEQFVADMGRNLIQGTSQFFARKMREVKVNLKAGYKVFLLPENPL